MNEFTKEELEIIHLDICVYLNKSKLLKTAKKHIQLRDKVREMINDYDVKVISLCHCEKCGHIQ